MDAIWTDYTLRTVVLGSLVLGATGGVLGSFTVLRRRSLLGDTVSHAALPGIVLAFLITGEKSPAVLLLGAATAGWLGTLLVIAVLRTTRIPEDGALGLLLAVFFGLGLVLLTAVQRMPGANKAGLDRFLFGQAAGLLASDVLLMAGLGAVVVALVLLFWKEFKLLSFDPEFAASLGLPVRALDVGLTWLTVMAIVLGLQSVGVVLMSAMLVAPAAAARQWTDRLGVMVALAAALGALGGAVGAVVSATATHVPAGPASVLAVTALAVLSLLFAPRRGVLAARLADVRRRRRTGEDAVLADLRSLSGSHDDPAYAHPASVLAVMGVPEVDLARTLRSLEARGLVHHDAEDRWGLTPRGVEEADARARRREEGP